MYDEVENSTPTAETNIDSEDFFADVDNEVLTEQGNETPEETKEEVEETPSTDTETETQSDEIDLKPFLEYLSKNVKYNKESVNVDNIEEVISNIQKGLNYDKVQEKLSNLQNSKAETYINKKAKELGMSVDEYMEQVEQYEAEQEKQKNETKVQEMIEHGVPEDVAREVVATSQLRKQLEAERNELKAQREAQEAEKQKQSQYDEFIKAYPNVKAEDIPKEVFEASQGSSLKNAYTEYLLKETQQKLEVLQKNAENSKSVVGSTTEHDGKTSNKSQDLFLQGFDSD